MGDIEVTLKDIQDTFRALPTYQNVDLTQFQMYARQLVWMQRQWMVENKDPKDEMTISYLDRTLSIERLNSTHWNLVYRQAEFPCGIIFTMPLYTNEIAPELLITDAATELHAMIEKLVDG
jgi:hypothetical protein